MKGVRRAKNEGRIVLTLVVSLDSSEVPAGKDGVDVMRGLLGADGDGLALPIGDIIQYLEMDGITVKSHDIEVTK